MPTKELLFIPKIIWDSGLKFEEIGVIASAMTVSKDDVFTEDDLEKTFSEKDAPIARESLRTLESKQLIQNIGQKTWRLNFTFYKG